MEQIIEVSSLGKIFGNQRALIDVSFDIKKGEIFGFLGPSGSGKTTTIKILTGQLDATSGSAKVFSKPVGRLNNELSRKIGVLSDNSGLYSRLSVEENLKLFCDLYDESYSRVDEVLEMVNLKEEKKKLISKLSKGMTQRILLARAFLHKPELLFLDEPTSALDPVNTKHIYQGLQRLRDAGTTIFLTTHDMYEAEVLCDRVAFLSEGRIQLLDTPKALRQKFSEPTLTVETTDGKKIVISKGPDGAETMHELMSKNRIVSVSSNEPTLGDIFVNVTGRKLA